ncbi:MAG: hypothetical protein HKN16_12670 [Saprospiraceae bacterium]|nr:hypothetical protein [Saprospiraceae bacterium]
MNDLLHSQIKEAINSRKVSCPKLQNLLKRVSDSYDQEERDRKLIDRAKELSSKELKDNYEKLKEQESLKRSNEKLGHFVSMASHDLKAPLRTIGAFTQLLEKKLRGSLDEDSKEYMDFVIEGVDRMNTLIEDLIRYSKIEKKKGDPKIIDTHLVMEKVCRNLHQLMEENQGELIIKTELPNLIGQEFQVIQLFQNLIGNAFKFRGENAPVVEVDYEETDGGFVFSISDNGIGIEESQVEKVFEVFHRLNNSTDFEGSGLGLSICKKIVESLGGDIWLSSQKGVGTTFFFSIPKESVLFPACAA